MTAKNLILEKYPSGVEVTFIRDPGTTGNFEVTVNGELIISKKTKGHTFLHQSVEQQTMLWEAIDKAIAA